jgi:hypothetical protein
MRRFTTPTGTSYGPSSSSSATVVGGISDLGSDTSRQPFLHLGGGKEDIPTSRDRESRGGVEYAMSARYEPYVTSTKSINQLGTTVAQALRQISTLSVSKRRGDSLVGQPFERSRQESCREEGPGEVESERGVGGAKGEEAVCGAR